MTYSHFGSKNTYHPFLLQNGLSHSYRQEVTVYKFTRGWVKILQQHSNSFRYDYSVILQAFVKTTLEYEVDGHLGEYILKTLDQITFSKKTGNKRDCQYYFPYLNH